MQKTGNTPLLRLTENLQAKAEFYNPTGSAKDRAAWFMVSEAESAGALRPGGILIEPTSGNTGISLAAIAQQMGYSAMIVMPDSMSMERRKKMEAYGAQTVLTPAALGMAGAIQMAQQLAQELPGSFIPNQFENPANAMAHYCTTGPEIWQQTEGRIDIFVAGVGTGGTVTGVGRYLKEKKPNIRIVAVEPAKSAVLSGGRAGSHGIQGIGAGFVPGILDPKMIDEIIPVSDEDAFAAAKKLGKAGISAGISSGAAVWAAGRIAAQHPQKQIVTLLPDSADRYASLGL